MTGNQKLLSAYLVNFSRTCLEALELLFARLVVFMVEQKLFGGTPLSRDRRLAVDEVDREPVGIFDSQYMSAPRCISHLLDTII